MPYPITHLDACSLVAPPVPRPDRAPRQVAVGCRQLLVQVEAGHGQSPGGGSVVPAAVFRQLVQRILVQAEVSRARVPGTNLNVFQPDVISPDW